MHRIVIGVGLVVVAGACKEKKAAPAATQAPVAAPAPVEPAPLPPAPPPPPPPADQSLPLSAEVLPKDEATPKTRVVAGNGFRFQVPDGFARIAHDGAPAYAGSIEGFAGGATVTLWAASEPFTGTLDELTAREVKAATAGGAPEPDVGPVLQQVAGEIKQAYAQRMTIRFPDRIELRTLVVHDKKAFIHHCETPNVANAWANVGSDCITRALTFHIAPPPLAPVAKPAGPPPPETANVTFMASKVKGAARAKEDVKAWLDTVAPYIKPCLAKLASGSSWHVAIDVDKDGGIAKLVVGDGDALVAEDSVGTCVRAALDAHKLTSGAADVVSADAVFVIQ